MLCKILYSVTAPFAVFKHRTAMKDTAVLLRKTTVEKYLPLVDYF